GVDDNGKHYRVTAQYMEGAPTADVLARELAAQHPILLSYRSGPATGHAVVLTGSSFAPTSHGLVLSSLVIRDPAPFSQVVARDGRTEYPANQFAPAISSYWIIRVQS